MMQIQQHYAIGSSPLAESFVALFTNLDTAQQTGHSGVRKHCEHSEKYTDRECICREPKG